MRFEYTRVDVFTDRPLTGNGLAVFTEATSLSAERMQMMARELNLSESTFVVSRSPGRAKVRIFTPEGELPFAGHPSLGTASVLVGRGASATIVLELGVGDVPVTVDAAKHGSRAELIAPPAKELPLPSSAEALARALGLDPQSLDPELAPAVWSCGNAFTYVPLRSKADVERARCPATDSHDSVGVMAFARVGPNRIHARVFCPGSAVPEDPATGSANAPLAAFLHARGLLPIGQVLITTQGVEMGRPSVLQARLVDDGDVLRPHVSGDVAWCGGGWIEFDD